MSDPQITAEADVIEGVILKNPKVRNIVSAGLGIVGLALGALHAWFNGHDPVWLTQSLLVYSTILAPAAFGIWKANVK